MHGKTDGVRILLFCIFLTLISAGITWVYIQEDEVNPDPLNELQSLSALDLVKTLAHEKYSDRRNRITQYCQNNKNESELIQVSQDSKWNQDLWFNYQHRLLFCQISKISSSTWVEHLMKLIGRNVEKYIQHLRTEEKLSTTEFRPTMRNRFFALKNDSFVQAKDSLLSFVFVREPFQRLASSYYDKMDRDFSKPVWDLRWMRDEIIKKYRKIDPKTTGAKPTPNEFVQYILDSAEEKGASNLDNHIKPVWASCPFCSVNFDVVGRLEEFDKDSGFIYITMDLSDKLNVNLHKHAKAKPKGKQVVRDKYDLFYSKVSQKLKMKLFEYCRRDYEMFGYDPPMKYMME